MTSEEQIGYLTGKVEALGDNLDKHIESEDTERVRQTLAIKKEFEKMHACMDKMQQQLSLYRHFIMFLRMSAAIVLAIMAFKFGDVAKLWEAFWHAS